MKTLLSRRRRSAGAFTLIEMLVVVLILSVLLSIAIPLFLSSVKTTAEATAKANLKNAAAAAQAHRVRTGSYPGAFPITDASGAVDMALPVQAGVVYALDGAGGVTATEDGTADVFHAGTKTDVIKYDLTTGAFTVTP